MESKFKPGDMIITLKPESFAYGLKLKVLAIDDVNYGSKNPSYRVITVDGGFKETNLSIVFVDKHFILYTKTVKLLYNE